MMNRSYGQQQKMILVTLESLMPEKHFLRDLDRIISFDFVYEKVGHLYSNVGRRSIDPVVIVKMLLIGYLYGIDSERRLEQEIRVNIAYRWFLGIDLDEPVPDHSTFSQLRRRKFNNSALFEEIFAEVVKSCIEHGLVDGKLLLTDSTHVKANAKDSAAEIVNVDVEPSEYVKRLNERAKQDGIYPKSKKQPKETATREVRKSITDPESGYMNRAGKPLGFYYLSHQTCDSLHGLITDVYVTPGNISDCTVHSKRIQHQMENYGFSPSAICADGGYDSSEIHKDMLDKGIKTYIPKRKPRTNDNGLFPAEMFEYISEDDVFICPEGHMLTFSYYMPQSGVKSYACKGGKCRQCSERNKCVKGSADGRRVFASYDYSATKQQHEENDFTPEYLSALRLRQIWCEGNFSHQKAHHNLSRVRTRGLGKASVHCLLSATAFNLKRMVKLLSRG